MEALDTMNYTELIAGGTIGAVLGFIISEFKGYIVRIRTKKKIRERYEVICGEYKRTLNSNEYVKAIITYQYDNILEIDTRTYRDDVMQEYWKGEIKWIQQIKG